MEATTKIKRSVQIRQQKEAAKLVVGGSSVAKLQNCPTSPRKMRLVVDLIRGVNVEKALYILKFTNKEAAIRVEKLLLSAIKNWEAKNEGKRVEDSNFICKGSISRWWPSVKKVTPGSARKGFPYTQTL
jgi:large subunit ribosomal protein L22